MLDVDGVLITGRPADGLSWSTDLERDLGISPADLQREFFRKHWDDIIVGHAGIEEGLAAALDRIAPHMDPGDLMAYWFGSDSRIEPAVLEDVASCRAAGIAVWLATNQEHRRAAYLMNELGLALYVDGILYSAELGCRKPETAFYRQAELRTGFAPGELLLVDDTPANVAAAIEAGWNAVRWTGEAPLAIVLRAVQRETQGT